MSEGFNLEDMTMGEKLERLEWAFRNKDYGMYGTLVDYIGRERVPCELWDEKLIKNYEFEKRRSGGFLLKQPKLEFRVEKYSFIISSLKTAAKILSMGKSRKDIVEMMKLAGYRDNTDLLDYPELLKARRILMAGAKNYPIGN